MLTITLLSGTNNFITVIQAQENTTVQMLEASETDHTLQAEGPNSLGSKMAVVINESLEKQFNLPKGTVHSMVLLEGMEGRS